MYETILESLELKYKKEGITFRLYESLNRVSEVTDARGKFLTFKFGICKNKFTYKYVEFKDETLPDEFEKLAISEVEMVIKYKGIK